MNLLIHIIKNFLGFLYFTYLKFIKKNIIFLFHDVTNNPSSYSEENKINMNIKNFKKIIKHIDNNYEIISPALLQNNSHIKNKHYALITFDDGYKSYIKDVVPILKKKKIPSLIFLNAQVSIYNKENVSAIIDYFSKDEECQNYMNRKKINKPYFLNFDIKKMKNFLREYHKKYKKEKNKIFEFQGKYLNEKDLKKLDKQNLVYYGNHLFNHWNIINLKKNEIQNQYTKNKKSLEKYKSFCNFFAIPNGKINRCYNNLSIEILKKLKPQKIFSSNNHIKNNFNELLIDRVSLENNDNHIYHIYFKIFKNKLSSLISNS